VVIQALLVLRSSRRSGISGWYIETNKGILRSSLIAILLKMKKVANSQNDNYFVSSLQYSKNVLLTKRDIQ